MIEQGPLTNKVLLKGVKMYNYRFILVKFETVARVFPLKDNSNSQYLFGNLSIMSFYPVVCIF